MKVRALTLWRPWTTAILHGPKRIENRPRRWNIPREGLLLAIHGGKKFDRGGAKRIRELWPGLDDHQHPTGIVGVCRAVEVREISVALQQGNPWAFGPYCYFLEDVVAFQAPIPLRGQMGLFRLEPHIEAWVVGSWEGGLESPGKAATVSDELF